LLHTGLVQERNGYFEITELGRDFLVYLTVRRMPENKPW
jgi:hypothetical protein